MLDLAAEGTYVAVRPSGTEPKVKYYMFTYEPAEQLANLDDTKAQHAERLAALGRDLTAFSQLGLDRRIVRNRTSPLALSPDGCQIRFAVPRRLRGLQ